ncbi:MAG: hypothetical protein KBG85_14355, partial [Micropruina sp.]|nr:hypothetical protein [Micropruina sp.]
MIPSGKVITLFGVLLYAPEAGGTRVTVEDPRPTLDLLWNGIPAPRRGPRHRLTIERIVGAATAIAEEDGVAGLSMRR